MKNTLPSLRSLLLTSNDFQNTYATRSNLCVMGLCVDKRDRIKVFLSRIIRTAPYASDCFGFISRNFNVVNPRI